MQSAWRLRNDNPRIIDKENVEQQNKVPSANVVVHKVTSPLSRAKPKRNSDISDDRLSRPKGLQVTATNILNNVPRTRLQSSSDASTTRSFVKTRFSVYDDGKSKGANQLTEKRSILKSKESDKPVKSVYHARCIPSALIIEEKQKDDNKSSDRTSDLKKSPKNLPIITQPDVCKIKEKYNKRSTERKTPKVAYEILSIELAYNIDYMTEYIRYQMEINEKKKLSPSFLKRGIIADQRRLIVKYLIAVTTYHKSPSFILYQAVKIFDSYIDKIDVSLDELQTVALAALWIALKKDQIIDDVPEAETMMELAGNNDKKPLLECEKKILMSLKFEIYYADPFSMLALYMIMIEEVRELASSSIQELYYCGSYLIDLSLLDKDLCDISALHLAEVCTEIALVLVMPDNDHVKNALWDRWRTRILQSNPILEKYLLPDSEINYIRNQLLQKAVLSRDKKTDFYSVYKKYCTKRYGAISVFFTSKISSLFVSKIIDPSYPNRPVIF